MKNATHITKEQLIDILKEFKGCQTISIQYITEPKNLTKEGKEKYKNLYHIAAVNALLGYNYQNSVNNQRERENIDADFQAKPLWNGKGKHINACLATHTEKNEFYIVYKFNHAFKSLYINNYATVNITDLKPYFKISENKSQGTETIIMHRLININNVRKIKLNKIEYIIN